MNETARGTGGDKKSGRRVADESSRVGGDGDGKGNAINGDDYNSNNNKRPCNSFELKMKTLTIPIRLTGPVQTQRREIVSDQRFLNDRIYSNRTDYDSGIE